MRVQPTAAHGPLHDAEGRHAKKSEQHEECDGHAEGDGNIAVDARIAEQSGQVGAKVHGHVPEAENAGNNGQLGPDRLHSTVESLLLPRQPMSMTTAKRATASSHF